MDFFYGIRELPARRAVEELIQIYLFFFLLLSQFISGGSRRTHGAKILDTCNATAL